MSDWAYLNKHRVRLPTLGMMAAGVPPLRYCSTDEDGFNGMFRMSKGNETIRCLASDGSGEADECWHWQHVSVSVERDGRPPRWSVMCWVKDLFWEPEQWVVQYHPAASEYVNYHPGCLHLWRPLKLTLPTPMSIMVGPKKST